MRIFQIKADRETGEWIGEPVDMNEGTSKEDWDARVDSEDFHYDTAEIDGETIAIVCEWID